MQWDLIDKSHCACGGWKSPLMPCQVLCQVMLMHTHSYTNINRSVIIMQRLTSGELIVPQGRPGTHPPTGLLLPPPPSLLSTQWGGGVVTTHTHILTRTQSTPCRIKQLLYCVSVFFSFFQSKPALTVKTGAVS